MKVREKIITALRVGGLILITMNGIDIIKELLSLIIFKFILPNLNNLFNFEVNNRLNPALLQVKAVLPSSIIVFIIGLVLYILSKSMEKNTEYENNIFISKSFTIGLTGLIVSLVSLNALIMNVRLLIDNLLNSNISFNNSIIETYLIYCIISLIFSILTFVTGILMFFINIKKDEIHINKYDIE